MDNLKLFAVYRMDNNCPVPLIVKAETKEEAIEKCKTLYKLHSNEEGRWKAKFMWAYQQDPDVFYITNN